MTTEGRSDPARSSAPDIAGPRSFGYAVGGVLVLIAAWLAWRGRTMPAVVCGAVGAVLIILARVRPRALRGPAAAWFALAHVLGRINARIILSAFFLLVLTPVGLVMRLAGRDALHRRRGPAPGWVPYPTRQRDARHYSRMY